MFKGVPDRAELESDQVIEPVSALGRCGEAEPVAGRDGAYRGLERRGWDVIALIDNHQAISAEEFREVIAPDERLVGRYIDDAGELGASASELAGFSVE